MLTPRPLVHWVRLFAGIAAAICLLLIWKKLRGEITSLAGCGGPEGGCAQVLGGRWSSWMGVPVTYLALGIYLSVLLLTFSALQRGMGGNADRLLCAASLTTVLAAAWFVAILVIKVKAFCPYCAAAHAAGLCFSVPILVRAARMRRERSRGLLAAAISVAVPAVMILALGQTFGPVPDTFQITQGAAPKPSAPPVPSPDPTPAPAPTPSAVVTPPSPSKTLDMPVQATTVESAPSPAAAPIRVVPFYNGDFKYALPELPLIGSPTAKHIMVEYFDYTCGSCRDMYGDLKEMNRVLGADFAVIVLPSPLSRTCNPHLRPEIREHPNACELATLSLAFWRAAPEKFPGYHSYLMTQPLPLEPATARAEADRLAGAEKMDAALKDPWVKQRLSENLNHYKLFSSQNPRMPKLLLRDDVMMHGPAPDTARFIMLMRQQFPRQ